MIKSMTGFGRSEYSDGKRNTLVEIKSVNHRYGEISIKMPRRYSFAEEKIRSTIKETVRRGKVDVSIIVENLTEDDVTVKLNAMVAKQYIENLNELRQAFDLQGDVTLQFLSTLPDVMKAAPDVEDEDEIWEAMRIPLEQAVKNLDDMRMKEGKKLSEDLLMRGELIRGFVKQIEERAPRVSQIYAEKLRERIKELLGNHVTVPEDRIALEAAIFADKCNVTEELVRLDSHMIQLKEIIGKSSQPAGKKLDFLVQEMNRETNTIGSKANDIDITNLMLEIKSEIEKIREQVQNIE